MDLDNLPKLYARYGAGHLPMVHAVRKRATRKARRNLQENKRFGTRCTAAGVEPAHTSTSYLFIPRRIGKNKP